MEKSPYYTILKEFPGSEMDALEYDKDPGKMITRQDYVYNLNIPVINFDNSPHICIIGKTQTGKTTFIANLITHHFAH